MLRIRPHRTDGASLDASRTKQLDGKMGKHVVRLMPVRVERGSCQGVSVQVSFAGRPCYGLLEQTIHALGGRKTRGRL